MNKNYKTIENLTQISEAFSIAPHKDRILSYLKSGKVIAAAAGRAVDVLTKKRIPDEWLLFTDGEYQWDTSLIHHFDKYNIPLPDDFVEHVLRKENVIVYKTA